jgi:hypothetical protein
LESYTHEPVDVDKYSQAALKFQIEFQIEEENSKHKIKAHSTFPLIDNLTN